MKKPRFGCRTDADHLLWCARRDAVDNDKNPFRRRPSCEETLFFRVGLHYRSSVIMNSIVEPAHTCLIFPPWAQFTFGWEELPNIFPAPERYGLGPELKRCIELGY